MKRNNAIIVLSICVMFLAGATAAAEEKTWFSRKDEGWFFYKSTPPPPKERPRREKSTPEKQEANSKPAHQRIKETGEMILGNAMVNPTEENVRAYMEYQKKMLDDANRFSQVWERVLAKYPDLYLSQYASEQVAADMTAGIKALAAKTGLFFFFRSDCPHCHREAEAIIVLREKYGFGIFAVSLDGGGMPGLEGITVADNGISENLSVNAVPAIYLAYPEEDRFEPVSQGYLSLIDIERRLYHYAQMETQGEYNSVSVSDFVLNRHAR